MVHCDLNPLQMYQKSGDRYIYIYMQTNHKAVSARNFSWKGSKGAWVQMTMLMSWMWPQWQLHGSQNFNDSYPSEGPLVIKQVDRLYPSLDLPRLAYRPGGPSCRQKKQKTTVPKARDRRFLQGQTHAQAHHGRESLHKLGNVKHWILNKPATWTTLAHGY